VVIEALTCGTPVVGFAVGGIPELLNAENGVLVGDSTVESLAAALHEALFGREFDRTSIQAGAAKFDPQVVLEKYRAVYAELMAP
jgi:glycosyltransferase involved in cell wall biosynthesis